MATYTFKAVPAWGSVGQFARIGTKKSTTFPCTLPGGGDATVVQGGTTKVGYLESDSNGLIPEWTTTDVPSVDVDFGVAVLRVNSEDAITAGASSAAAAADAATSAATSATDAQSARTGAETARDDAVAASLGKTLQASGTAATDLSNLNSSLSSAATFAVPLHLRGSFAVNDTVTVPAGVVLDMRGSTITQTGTSKATLDVNAASNVTIQGGLLVGKGTDFVAGSSLAIGITVRGGSSNVRVKDVTTTAQAGVGIKVDASTDVTVQGCTVVGTSPPASTGSDGSQFGILVEGASSRVRVLNNNVSATSQGIITSIASTDVAIHGNTVTGITGQHGMYVQTGARVSVLGNIVDDCNLCGIKLQINDSATSDVQRVKVSDNIVSNVGSHGILISNVAATFTYRFRDVSVTGNVVTDTSQDGINLHSIGRGVVADNVVRGTTRHGLIAANCDDLTIGENRLHSLAQYGIYLNAGTGTTMNRVRIHGNTIVDPATADTAGSDYGIYVLLGTDVTVEANIVRDTANKMRYGFFFGGGDQTSLTFRDNTISGATDYAARFIAGTACKSMRGNLLTGTLGPVLNAPSNWTTNPDTSGATLAALETEVNELKAVLRASGLIAS